MKGSRATQGPRRSCRKRWDSIELINGLGRSRAAAKLVLEHVMDPRTNVSFYIALDSLTNQQWLGDRSGLERKRVNSFGRSRRGKIKLICNDARRLQEQLEEQLELTIYGSSLSDSARALDAIEPRIPVHGMLPCKSQV